MRTAVLEHLNFFKKVISERLAVHVKINEKNKALILLSSLLQSYDHIINTMLYSKETLILEKVMSTLLSKEIRKRPNQGEQEGLVVTGRKGRREGKKDLGSSKTCHFCYKVGY